MYSANSRTSQCMKEKLMEMKAEVDRYIITAGDLNSSSGINSTSGQKIVQET